jgi:hypothetical protein
MLSLSAPPAATRLASTGRIASARALAPWARGAARRPSARATVRVEANELNKW